MNLVGLQSGIDKAIDALYSDRLALVCGAGLSMAAPSSLPSAATIAAKAKEKYDATYGTERDPLPEQIDDQAEYFFRRDELANVYLRTYIDRNSFAAVPNAGHFAAADLLLVGAVATAVSTNVDCLIETAGNMLFGQVGAGVSRSQMSGLPNGVSPFLKIHGCWSDPANTIWAPGQVDSGPLKERTEQSAAWLTNQLLNRDILIVGYWTDWDYLNHVLELTLGAVSPSRVIVVDPCETSSFEAKAPALFALGQRASHEFCHVKCSGDGFLDGLRTAFSRSFLRRVLVQGKGPYKMSTGSDPDATWLEPAAADSETLWRIRRDLEGCGPNEPAKARQPFNEPLLGMTLLQLQAQGARPDGSLWNLGGRRVRVLRAANQAIHEVEATYARETPPVIAPDCVIAVGSEALALPPSFARGGGTGSIARGSLSRWLSRSEAVSELSL